MIAAPDAAPISITIAEHPRRPLRHYRAPGRVVRIAIRLERHFEVSVMTGYKTQAAATVRFRF